ncbi:TPA: hypothetical protein QDC06_002603 [Burkholderia cepacia]|nr:hypothetical protein [Burkholderia cepacia]
MSTGIVIYGTDPTQAASALSVAESLFLQFGGEANKASLLEFVLQNGERFIDGHDVSLADLKGRISTGEVAAFQVYNDGEKVVSQLFHLVTVFRNSMGYHLWMSR